MKKLSVLLALLLVLSLSVPAVASAASAEPVRVFTLNGTTGFGLAGLIAENKDGGASQEYSFSVETDASNVTAALVNGDCDIAALPTNAVRPKASNRPTNIIFFIIALSCSPHFMVTLPAIYESNPADKVYHTTIATYFSPAVQTLRKP